MQSKSWQIHISRGCGGLQPGKYQSNSLLMLRLYSSFRPFCEETLESAVRKLLYHDATVTRYDSGVHIFIRHNARVEPHGARRVEPVGSNELIGGEAAVVNSLRKDQLAQ